jgi:hypothetical protein
MPVGGLRTLVHCASDQALLFRPSDIILATFPFRCYRQYIFLSKHFRPSHTF